MLDWKEPLALDAVVDRGLALFNATLPRAVGFAVGAGLAANLLAERLLGPHEAEMARLVGAGDLAGLTERFGAELMAVALAFYLLGCAVLLLVGSLGRGVELGIGELLGAVLRRLPHLLLASVLFALAAWAGLMLLVVPGVFVMVALSFFSQAVLFDGHDGVRALGASFRLTRGLWWRTFALYLLVLIANVIALMLVGLALGVVQGGLRLVGAEGAGSAVELVASSVLGALIGLATDAVLIAYYYDLTVRAGVAAPRAPDTLAV